MVSAVALVSVPAPVATVPVASVSASETMPVTTTTSHRTHSHQVSVVTSTSSSSKSSQVAAAVVSRPHHFRQHPVLHTACQWCSHTPASHAATSLACFCPVSDLPRPRLRLLPSSQHPAGWPPSGAPEDGTGLGSHHCITGRFTATHPGGLAIQVMPPPLSSTQPPPNPTERVKDV